MFPECIETDRLTLTPLTTECVDVLDYHAACSKTEDEDIEDVTAYLPWNPHTTPKETMEFLAMVTQQRRDGENAEYLVYPDDEDDFAGVVGLNPNWDRRTADLGIWLRKPFWGRGYYAETFTELAAVTFDRLDLELVEIIHRHGNEKSRRATEKFIEACGGRYEGCLRNFWTGPDDIADAHRYTVSKAEFEEEML